MCGIVGYVAEDKKKVRVLIDGLKKLEYRGYDSAGVAFIDDDKIRYGMYAIKSVGRSVIDRIVDERVSGGKYTTIENFITRVNSLDVNKRAIENLIKAGALDGLDGNRRQMLSVYSKILDNINADKKKSIEGQMSFFDVVSDDEKTQFEITLPSLPEYDKETLLEFEKEALNIYVSGHPLEEYTDIMDANVTNVTTDLIVDEATGECKVNDGAHVIIGGLVAEKSIKYTKNNQPMAFITIEDLVGQAEVIVFPNIYSESSMLLDEESKILIYGRVDVSDDRGSKIICEAIKSFDDVNKVAWVLFDTKDDYNKNEDKLLSTLKSEENGDDRVWIFIKKDRLTKGLGEEYNIKADDNSIALLKKTFGEKAIKVQREKVKFNRIKRY